VINSRLAVIKVGGSLFDWPELPERLTEFLNTRRGISDDERAVLLAGGGRAADLVRLLDRVHGLGDERAHRLALHALDLTAFLLAALVPGNFAVVDRTEALAEAWNDGWIPVLAPRLILSELDRSGHDPLPACWEVTSDAIAARIAVYLQADCLVLLKSAPLPFGTTCQGAVRLGLVDPMLPRVARAPRVLYLNLREPQSGPMPLNQP
jgi:aspartokinase-like uncharacterized kinase